MYQRKLTDIFFTGILKDYKVYSSQMEQAEDLEEFLIFLLDNEIISENKVQQYAIKDLFEKKYELNAQKKTKTIHEIAQIVKLSPRQIWSIISKI